jgi:KIF-binding protein
MKVQPERFHLPPKYDDHNVRPAMLCHFYIGRLYSKLICNENSTRLDNCKQTLRAYSYIVDYCERQKLEGNNHPIEQMKVEYELCKEMISYLPAKMDKIREKI